MYTLLSDFSFFYLIFYSHARLFPTTAAKLNSTGDNTNNNELKTSTEPTTQKMQIAARPGAHKLRCLFRVTFVPLSAATLAQKDLNSLDYLYMQCCNDVTVERFSPELQPDVALRLAALHIHQHSLANNISPAKLTVKTVE